MTAPAFRLTSPATQRRPVGKNARNDERGARQRATPAWEERESLERWPPVDFDWWPLFMGPTHPWDRLKSCDRARSASAPRFGETSIRIHHCWSCHPHAPADETSAATRFTNNASLRHSQGPQVPRSWAKSKASMMSSLLRSAGWSGFGPQAPKRNAKSNAPTAPSSSKSAGQRSVTVRMAELLSAQSSAKSVT